MANQTVATVGVLSIGQMGLAVSQLLLAHGYHVVTNVQDRSSATQARARSASLECLSSDGELVARADYILSIVPPKDAMRTALRIATVFEHGTNIRVGKQEPLYYLDLNAVSPGTARNIASLFEQEPRVRFVDGGIIGGPPSISPESSASNGWQRPGIPISGPHALQDAPVQGKHLADILNTQYIDASIGTASGLKCTFASLSKGFTAIALQSYSTAATLGVLPQLQNYIAEYNPSAKGRAEKGITGCLPKAYRWVEEMNQIGECFAVEGGHTVNVFRDIANVYEELAQAIDKRGGAGGIEDLSGALSVLTEGHSARRRNSDLTTTVSPPKLPEQ